MNFKAYGYDLWKPTEHDVWSDDPPVKDTVHIDQVYYGENSLDRNRD